MKVAIIINTSWNIYNFRKGLVKHLISEGHQVLAIAPKDDFSIELEKWGCEFEDVPVQGTGMNPASDLKLLSNIYRVLKKHRPDVVLSYTIKPNLYASIAAGVLGIPCICNVSGLGTVFLWKGAVRKLAVGLYSFAFKFNKWVFFQNDEDRSEFLSFVHLNAKKTSLLPGSGINTALFQKANHLEEGRSPVFIMIARLIVEKGVRDYVEAIKLLRERGYPNLKFVLVGGLDEEHARAISRSELDSWIADGLIDYKGQLADVVPEITAADVVVLPSYREGTPRTLLEGGALGKVLMTTDVPGCRHVVVHGENGFLFRLKDPNDLAQKIEDFMKMPLADQKIFAENARSRTEKVFDERIVIQLYMDKIHELVPQ